MADAKPQKPETQEIAAGGPHLESGAHFAPFVNALGVAQNPDTVLAARGSGLKLYEEVLRDDQVFSTFQQRRLALISKELEILPGANDRASKMAADFLRETVEALDFDRICNRMMFAIFYGYAVGECMWAADGRRWTIEDIRVRKARRFAFGADGELKLERGFGKWETMPERKFWTIESGADNDDNPYGLGLGHTLYWPAYFKRHGLKFWLIFIEKFGAPTVVGKYPPNTTKEDIEKLLAAAAAVQSEAGVVIPAGMALELLESARQSGADQPTFLRQMNAAISKVVVGQTMTTDDGASLSQSEVHLEVRQELTAADSDLQCGSFRRGPAAWLTELNFPGAAVPVIRRNVDPPEDLDKRADRDFKIYQMGYRPTPDYVRDTYGEGWEPRDMVAPGGGPSFAETGVRDAIDAFTQDGLDDHWEPAMEPLVAEIEAALAGLTTQAQAEAALARLFPTASEGAMAQLLARIMFMARVAGSEGAEISGGDDAHPMKRDFAAYYRDHLRARGKA